ncbi:MAG: efflux RND transporter periplasmic adaptor subunit [bacterium]|nr:efflux RND transporter periplasmic adaptor subunit [bacterium]
MSTPGTMRNPLTLGFAGLVIVISITGAVYMKRVADARTLAGGVREAVAHPLVETVVVAPRRIPAVFDVRGFLSGFEEVAVRSEVSGRVIDKPVSDGQVVDRGVVLCGIDETFYSLAVQKAEANLAAAKGRAEESVSAVAVALAQQEDARAARDHAQVELKRVQDFSQTQDSAKIELLRCKTQCRRAEAQLRSAEAAHTRAEKILAVSRSGVALAESTLAEAREHLSRCRIVAPISGVIDRTACEVGEYVAAGQPLGEIIHLARMKLTVELSGGQVAALSPQTQAEVWVDAVPGVVYPAVLDHVAPKADPLTRRFRVEFHLANEDGRLRAGLFGRVRIPAGSEDDITVVPRRAIFRRFGADFGFVVVEREGGSVAELRRVTVEDLPGELERVRITEGLEVGERVAVKRPRNLKNGAQVSATETGGD